MSIMPMLRRLAPALAALLVCAGAHAAVDCDKKALSAGEKLSRYLLDYAGACVADQPAPIFQAYKFIPAWSDVAQRFAALPRPSGLELSAAHEKLAARAQRAAEAFKADVLEHAAKGEALYGNVAWRLPRSIGTPFPNPQELLFPALPSGEALIDIAGAADADCQDAASERCRQALEGGKALMLAWRLAHDVSRPLALEVIGKLGDQVALKRALWNRYLYESKPMLPLDHIATDFFDGRWKDSDQYPDGVREPPRTQYFLLHPSVAVEHLNAATDGEQFKPVLVLEVLGVNRWREDQRWIDAPILRSLSGAALAISYADRAGVKDTGAGVLLTFNNLYQFGVMRYDGKTGFLFSIDLANLWRDKYKDKYESFRTGLKNTAF